MAVNPLQIPTLFPQPVQLRHPHTNQPNRLHITRVVNATRIMGDGTGDHLAPGGEPVQCGIRLNNEITVIHDIETDHAHHHHVARHVQVVRLGRVRRLVLAVLHEDN